MIELNIRLDVRGQDNSAAAITKREIRTLTILGDSLHHRADYGDQHGTVPHLVYWSNKNRQSDRLLKPKWQEP